MMSLQEPGTHYICHVLLETVVCLRVPHVCGKGRAKGTPPFCESPKTRGPSFFPIPLELNPISPFYRQG